MLHNSTNFSQVQETEQENNADHLSKKTIKTGIKQFMDSHKQLWKNLCNHILMGVGKYYSSNCLGYDRN